VEKVQAGVITSSPGFRSNTHNPIMLALDPLLQNTPNFLPKYAETSCSNFSVRGPGESQPSRKQSSTAFISASPYASNMLGAYHTFLLGSP